VQLESGVVFVRAGPRTLSVLGWRSCPQIRLAPQVLRDPPGFRWCAGTSNSVFNAVAGHALSDKLLPVSTSSGRGKQRGGRLRC